MVKKMLNNGNKHKCGFSDEIVSYIYDETGESERKIFETHLVDCTGCTDEFAAISNARFSVFEWHKEEFAHLPTPEIVIPYAPKQRIVEEISSGGFLAGLRGLLSLANFPMAVAAALVVCVGVGFLAMNYSGGQQNIANNVNDRSIPPVEPRASIPPVVSTEPAQRAPEPVAIKALKNGKVNRENQPGNGTLANNRQPRTERLIKVQERKLGSDMATDHIPAVQVRKTVLSSDAENDDRSLRLSDLFDEDGGGL